MIVCIWKSKWLTETDTTSSYYFLYLIRYDYFILHFSLCDFRMHPECYLIACFLPLHSLRLHDPAGLHRATAAPVSALSSAGPQAEARVPPPAGSRQWHTRSPAQPDHRQHTQLPLRPHPRQRLLQHSPSGPLPGEHATGVRRPGAPRRGWAGAKSGWGWVVAVE